MKLLERKEPMDSQDRLLLRKDTLVRLCYEGGKPFWARLTNDGTLAKVDGCYMPPSDRTAFEGNEIRLNANNILQIL